MSSPLVVTLLHGTFATGAPWTYPTSPLAQALKRQFGDALVLTRIDWSGGNTHGARVAGTARLAAHLRDMSAQHPGARQFVVAHSHGGNVAFMACADPGVAAEVHGVVTLSTPYLHYRDSVSGALAVFVLLLAATVAGSTLANQQLQWPEAWRNAAMIGISFAGVGLLFLAASRSSQVKPAAFNLPALPARRVLILRSLGDEASGVLGLSSFLQWLTLRVQTRLFGLMEVVAGLVGATRERKLLFGMFAAVITLVMVFIDPLRRVFVYGVLAMVLATVLPLAVAVLLAPIRLVLQAAFGWDLPFRAWHLAVTAESTPPGDWRVTLLMPIDGSGRTGMAEWLEPLMHSEAYGHSEAIAQVVRWIGERRDATGDEL